jgi:hypothetical protein
VPISTAGLFSLYVRVNRARSCQQHFAGKMAQFLEHELFRHLREFVGEGVDYELEAIRDAEL